MRLAYGKKPRQVGLPPFVNTDSATEIMRGGYHGNRLLRNVDSKMQTLFINLGKPSANKFGLAVVDIQIDTVFTALF
jgi:hypothetical protein